MYRPSQNGYQDESTEQAYNDKLVSSKENKFWKPLWQNTIYKMIKNVLFLEVPIPLKTLRGLVEQKLKCGPLQRQNLVNLAESKNSCLLKG